MTDLRRYAWLSVAAAIATILLKGTAWWMTGSVGLLSDAIESFVNLAGALMALWMLTLAAQPADEKHPHGHGKAEYFSSAFEGFLIVVAAVSIAWTAIDRLLHPLPLEALGVGLLVSVAASIINFGTAGILLRAGRALRTRQAGRQSFISLHVLVPGEWTVTQGHDWAERIEADLREVIPHCHVTTHLEPAEDPRSMEDQGLDRHAP
jgi:divalent metal cation (Fe/Co/Zn/Cd) transporter